ncbi:hypothetical protein OsJ_27202 [Oryza sativa Japonica Group]|uniref:Uncharacterized protein n=1 Tax=Oryza sativa subsp. japonica TaxID=39947 RepID=B9G0R7_ORYSJ|nr:hypothetical protein OsJ_27202 [Oryza sativa Japonica Group]
MATAMAMQLPLARQMVFTEKPRGRGSVLPLLCGHPSTHIRLAVGCRPPTALRAQQPAAASAHAAHPVSLAVASALAAHPAILTTANPLNTTTEIAKQPLVRAHFVAVRFQALLLTLLHPGRHGKLWSGVGIDLAREMALAETLLLVRRGIAESVPSHEHTAARGGG